MSLPPAHRAVNPSSAAGGHVSVGYSAQKFYAEIWWDRQASYATEETAATISGSDAA
jgi:hypothetical protein